MMFELTAARRDGEWLRIPLPDPRPEGLEDGTHPHRVRQLLIERGIFPEKWLNRLFAAGGIRLDHGELLLHAFPAYDWTGHPLLDHGGESPMPADILYEDDWCLVLNKPAGTAVHPARPGHRGTLDESAVRHVIASGSPAHVRHIHRLDDYTSGPVLYAKNDLAQWRLDEAMREKRIDRQYAALVHGTPARRSGTIDAPIGKDRTHRSRRRVTPGGDHAVTHYETVAASGRYSLLRVRLETGRTHQIRVHLSHAGHPLAGDTLYGAPHDPALSHQALHGEQLTFVHPWTLEPLAVYAPWPSWFTEAAARAGIPVPKPKR